MSLITRGYISNGIVTRGYGVSLVRFVIEQAVKIFYRVAVGPFDRAEQIRTFEKQKPEKR